MSRACSIRQVLHKEHGACHSSASRVIKALDKTINLFINKDSGEKAGVLRELASQVLLVLALKRKK